ncbi:hypothetical protein CR194_05115 [Salipaludibacillus keqinensis]|uniref:Uncharacterized protein n=1 Tax=Salipaludibacillus keqinensis TaxID=2045207 RepID=A0A323TLR5_9BACI|nr:hypothetical protein [Salipaludibacillus keqinensis]PYZ94904.1 hypothetical protein CR194_05115 [Salipaludibacillus keqinensis]
MSKQNYWLIFFAGVAVTLIILPLLSALGVPTFDDVLVLIFGEDSILAIVFSLVIIIILLFWMFKSANRNA